MLWMRPFAWVNRNGSAAIASTGVVVNTENVVSRSETTPS